jgi:hypothetical protein
MEVGDMLGQAGHELGRHRLAVEQGRLGKAAHPHAIFQDRPSAGDARRLERAIDRDHIQIELRRQTAVEPQLFLAIEAAPLQGREIQKAEIERLLELVGIVPGQQHMRDMGLDMLDAIDCVRIGPRVPQCIDQNRQIVLTHRPTPRTTPR